MKRRRDAWPTRLVVGLFAVFTATLAFSRPGAAQEPCSDCHEAVLETGWEETAHGFLDCTDCHAGADVEDHAADEVAAACGECHDEAVEEYESSVHGEVAALEGEWGGGCSDCHGLIHNLRPQDDPQSSIHPASLAATCGTCHADPRLAEMLRVRRVQPLAAFDASVHARAVKEGREGATCSDCHRSHAIFKSGDPRSSVFHSRVPETCGSCHAEIAKVYRDSIHGLAAAEGIQESPVCTDCHGEHRILSPREAGSPVFATNLPKMTCGRCHGDERLAEKFGMDPAMVPAYSDSYHGLATRAGSVTVANCASCHGVHDILPSSDPRSHVHAANLDETCGRCHPGAGTVFAIGPVHLLPTESRHAAVYYIRLVYLWMIAIVIGALSLHNLLDLRRKALDPNRGIPPMPPRRKERMSLGFRIAHALLMGSFIVLAYTGFALKYPETWWAAPLLQWESSFGLRGWLHRVAGAVMLAAGAFHLVHLAVSRRFRRGFEAMRLKRADWEELKGNLAYFLGRRATKPPAAWIGYPEKVEYLAVIWGSVLMAATGLILWFESFVLRWGSTWITDVATAIHFYEAILACLAILVWHFYFVFFDPVVYPMDPAWLTGHSAPGRMAERSTDK